MVSAKDDLTDILCAAGLDCAADLDLNPAQARALIGVITSLPHLATVLRALVETGGTRVVHALADVVDPGSLVAVMVREGVLVECEVVQTLDRSGTRVAVPLYRAATPGEVERD